MADSGQEIPAHDHYLLVFLLLVVSFLLSASLPSGAARIAPLLFYLAALAVALRSARPVPSWARRLLWLLAAGSVAAVIAATERSPVVRGLVSLWLALILVLTILVVVRRILAHRVVTLQTIFGSLSAYLLIGFFFAALFAAIGHFQRGPLFTGGLRATSSTVQYFSFSTMTTAELGNIMAVREPGRTLATIEALTGQIFLATLIARLVSIFSGARNSRE